MSLSIRDQLALLTPEQREAYIMQLDPDELQLLLDEDWSVMGRPEQFLPDGDDWFAWLIRAGRGWGKTLTGSEGTKDLIERLTPLIPDGKVRWALGAPRHADIVNTMLEGETGLSSVLPPSLLIRGSWEASITRGAVPELKLSTGAIIQGYSATVPQGPRGPQFHGAWLDEPGSYADAHKGLDDDTFVSNLLFGLRLPPSPKLIITGTPKNNRLIKQLIALDGVIETVGRTADNIHNLADAFKRNIVARYAGTRLGRQELDAELLEGMGVMFQRGWFKLVPRAPWPDDTVTRTVRYWDLASGEESDTNADPDWTAGARVTFDPQRRLYLIEDITRFRHSPGTRELSIGSVARADRLPALWIEKEPGNAGKAQLHYLGREMDQYGVTVKGDPVSGPKAVRWELLSGPAEQGRVFMLEGAWNDVFLDEAEEAHPDPLLSGPHDDQLDAVAGAIRVLRGGAGGATAGAPAEGLPNIPRPGSRGAGTSPVPGRIDRGASLSRNRYR